MISIQNASNMNFDAIPIDPFWNTGESKELKMHRIHAYPAKFPAFITTKAIEFAKLEGVEVTKIADVCCGCGTVAYEAKRNNIDFWGCDINPVATMIAQAKSRKYQSGRLQKYYDEILKVSAESKSNDSYDAANERLKYWYDSVNYEALVHLKMAILKVTPSNSEYRLFFLCAFSNILKATSRWLTKSIKPQVDPKKKPADVMTAFMKQFDFMMAANKESDIADESITKIISGNFLDSSIKRPQVNMIITSPPYVTSYEYADLHQLSSLWLDFAKDYRTLRKGSIGSLHHEYNFEKELKRLNDVGSKVVLKLLDQYKSKARSVAKYFLDMQQVAEKSYSMLSDGGMALFVIGNTEYKGVRIENAQHLVDSLHNSGFSSIFVSKRQIKGKILTPYRDDRGRFTTDASNRKVYSEEFIVVGRK